MFSFVSHLYSYCFPPIKAKATNVLDKLNVVARVSVTPIGVGVSFSPYLTECLKVFQKHGLKTDPGSSGTDLSGNFEAIQESIRECHRILHEKKVPRVITTVEYCTRLDKPNQSIESRINSIAA